MSRDRIRLGNEPVVHRASPGGWTVCGFMYDSLIHDEVIRFLNAIPTDDPVDCMTCLVRETHLDVFTFLIEPEPGQ